MLKEEQVLFPRVACMEQAHSSGAFAVRAAGDAGLHRVAARLPALWARFQPSIPLYLNRHFQTKNRLPGRTQSGRNLRPRSTVRLRRNQLRRKAVMKHNAIASDSIVPGPVWLLR